MPNTATAKGLPSTIRSMATPEDRRIAPARKAGRSPARALAALVALGAISGCFLRSPSSAAPATVSEAPGEPVPPRVMEPLGEPGVDPRLPWAERTLAGLTLRQKVGQMMMPWMLGDFTPAGSASEARVHDMVDNQEVGGFIMSAGTPVDVAVKLNDLQEQSRLPLLIGSDLEAGAGFRLRGAVQPTKRVFSAAVEIVLLHAGGAGGAN